MAQSQKGYGLNNPLQDIFPQPVVAERAPTTGDTNYPIGQLWVNKSADAVYVFTSVAAGSATWTTVS